MGSVNTQIGKFSNASVTNTLRVGRSLKFGDKFYVKTMPVITDVITKLNGLSGKAMEPDNKLDGGNIIGLLIEVCKLQQEKIDELEKLIKEPK